MLCAGVRKHYPKDCDSKLAVVWLILVQPLLFGAIGIEIDFRQIQGSLIWKTVIILALGGSSRISSERQPLSHTLRVFPVLVCRCLSPFDHIHTPLLFPCSSTEPQMASYGHMCLFVYVCHRCMCGSHVMVTGTAYRLHDRPFSHRLLVLPLFSCSVLQCLQAW